jgi:non-heme chloroperoxidase
MKKFVCYRYNKQMRMIAVLLSLLVAFCCCNANQIRPKMISLPSADIEYAVHGSHGLTSIPIIALHGYTDAWYSYYLLMQELSNVKIYSLSLPCYGNSDKNEVLASSYDLLADVVIEFMDAKDIDEAYIMGHSMSSVLAPHIAYLYPERVAGVITIGPRASFINDPSMMDPENGFFAWINYSIQEAGLGPEDPFDYHFCYEWQASTVYYSPYRDSCPDWFIDECVEETMKVPSKCWIAGETAMSSVDYTETLKSIQKPVLVIYGDHDIFPWDAEVGGQEALELSYSGNPSMWLIKLWEVGHASHWEVPDVIADLITTFIQNIE